MSERLEETIQLLEQVQVLKASDVGRTDALGRAFELSAAVPTITRTIDFFRKIPSSSLQELGEGQRDLIFSQAQQFLNLYGRMMTFDPAAAGGNAAADRQGLLDEAISTYNSIFANLYPVVAYLTAQELDASQATKAAQETLLELRGLQDEGIKAIAAVEAESSRVLAEVRRTAAESGVSQQAVYFSEEADGHQRLAAKWQTYTNWSALGLGLFALLTLILSVLWSPADTYQTAQIALSKILIFSTIAFMLFLCSRTLIAHRHNEVVNKHRQNALLTFNALVEATGDEQTRQVVLTHASSCIFAPQETGFTKPVSGPPASPLVEVLPRLIGQHTQSHGG